MSKWEMVRLGDVCAINPPKSQTLSMYEGKEISFVPMSSVDEDGNINASDIRMFSEVSNGYTYFIENDTIFAKITPCMENGKGAIARGLKNGLGVGSTEFHTLRADEEKLISEWIYRFLSLPRIRKLAKKNMTGSAGQKRVPKAFLENVKIPLPPLNVQKHIADTLDKTQEIIDGHKKQLTELDNLIKAIFYEMFGDPVINEKGWNRKHLSDFYVNRNAVKCGPFGSALKKNEYTNYGIPVWIMDNISIDGDFLDKPFLYISYDKFKSLKNYKVENGDVIISRAGTVGKMCVINSKYNESIISTNLIRLRLNKDILPMWVVRLIKYAGSNLCRLKTGDEDAFTHMNTGVLNNISFPCPPLNLQNKFAETVTKIEEQKAIVEQAITESETLFNSLMSEYFD